MFRNVSIKAIVHLEKRFGSPLPQEIKQVLCWIEKHGNTKFLQIHQWVCRLNCDCSCISHENQTIRSYAVSSFWIHLYAFLTEYEKFYQDKIKLLISISINNTEVNEYKSLIDVYKKIEELFTENEIKLMKYQRHCGSHIHQDEYIIPKASFDLNKPLSLEDRNEWFQKVRIFLEKEELIKKELNFHTDNPFAEEEEIAKKYAQRLHKSEDFKKLVNYHSMTRQNN